MTPSPSDRSRSTIGLVCSEAIRANMAGVAIRYFELASFLAARAFQVRLVSPAPEDGLAPRYPEGVEWMPYEPGSLGASLEACQAVIGQGQLVNDLVSEMTNVPIAVDLYDPWLIENLYYAPALGFDPYRNDHASWMLQLSRGDLFLCSSREQRLFFLGVLTALGRVNPETLASDPRFDRLVRLVPFGLPEDIPAHRPVLPRRQGGESRLLFGGLYDWYDPMPVIEAVASGDESWRLLIVRNPDSQTPQQRFAEVEAWCRKRGLWGGRVTAIDWVPYERRYDLLRDVDLLVSTHQPSLETDLSYRTRFLDALAVGCPIVISDGGAISERLKEHDAGWVLADNEPRTLQSAIRDALSGTDQDRMLRGRQLADTLTWSHAFDSLLDFCERPWRDESKGRFTSAPSTVAPRDDLGFRARRRLRRWFGGVTG